MGKISVESMDEIEWDYTRENLIRYMAYTLASVVAYEFEGFKRDIGVKSDIKSATKEAKIWLEKSGDCKKLGKNVYVFKEKSSKKQKILEEETIKMVNEAYKLAKKTIKKNQKFFEGIYKALIKKKILSNGDIEKIYKKTQKKKK